jgi:hypothetical protein
MTMKLIKKTDEYSIFQRGDERYAVKDAAKKPVNGDEKVRILLAEGLIKVTEPAAPAEPEPAEEETVDEASAEASADDEAADDDSAE